MFSSIVTLTSTLHGNEWSTPSPGRLTHDEEPAHEAGWAPEPVWRGAENLAPTGI